MSHLSGRVLAMTRTVARKMGVREGARAYFHEAPESALAAMRLPPLRVVPDPQGELDHIHLFVVTKAAMEDAFPQLAAHLAPAGKLWVSWPKARQLGTDLTLPTVIHIGYRHGLTNVGGELSGKDALHGGDLLRCAQRVPREAWASGILAVPPHLHRAPRGVRVARPSLTRDVGEPAGVY